MAPMRGGEMRSPSTCCTKINTPQERARNRGGTTFIDTVEMGAMPVQKKICTAMTKTPMPPVPRCGALSVMTKSSAAGRVNKAGIRK